MADAAGLYHGLWRPETIGIEKAAQLIPVLERGLAKLEAESEEMRKHNPPNGWGSYEVLVDFVRDYLKACKESPEATVRVSR